MRTLKLLPVALLVFAGSVRALQPGHAQVKDPFFGEALFYANEGDYFDAIARLDAELKQYHGIDEPSLDTLHYHINRAEFSVGDFELSYRMHRRASRAITAVIEGNVPAPVRNEAIYRLARIYFNQGDNTNALQTIERIKGELPSDIANDIAFLRGQIYLAVGKFPEAGTIFSTLRKKRGYVGFAAYNLGVAEYAQGKKTDAFAAFDKAGTESGDSDALLAIKDKSNLVLGHELLDKGKTLQAIQYFDRVRLKGPFSDDALLQLGWANVKLGQLEKALVPWDLLIKRNPTNASVQQALVGVPYMYARLGMFGKSAVMYGSALDAMEREHEKLDASIKSIREGNFLKDLVREEVYKDRNWVVKLRSLPGAPETWYLLQLLASHTFQSALQNYLDLEQLRRKISGWEGTYDAFEDLIALRRAYYKPLLPSIDAQFRKLDSRMRLRIEQRDMLAKRLNGLLIAPNPELLATSAERIQRERIADVQRKAGNNPAVKERLARLKGVIIWNIRTQYDERLTQAFNHLDVLDRDIAKLQKIYESFVRTRQAATQSYEGYDATIRRLSQQTENASQQVNQLMTRQGHMLESMAIAELEDRRQTLEQSQIRARFAMAESYDRATTAFAKKQESTIRSADAAEKAKEDKSKGDKSAADKPSAGKVGQ